MNEHAEDHARELDALRALDSNARAEAPAALRRRIAGIPDQAPTGPMDRRTWFAAAAAAVAIAAAGAGFALTPHSDTGIVALTRPAPGEIAPAVQAAEASGLQSGGAAALGPARVAPDVASLSPQAGVGVLGGYWGWWGGRQHFTVPDFDTSDDQAAVYVLDGLPYFNIETLTGIAAKFGVSGNPVPNEYGGGWTIGDGMSGAPVLSLSSWGRSEIWFSSGHQSPVYECMTKIMEDSDSSGMTWDTAQAECQLATPQPTEAQAREWMGVVLDAFGVEDDDVTVEVFDESLEYESTLTVIASRVVNGMAMPSSIYMNVSHEGIINAGGQLGSLVSIGTYPIVSPAAAAERLNTSVFSPDLSYIEEPAAGILESEFVPPAAPAPIPAAGSPIPWGVVEHEIVSARLGLTSVFGADGTSYIVPAYEFTDTQGSRWSVIALAEESLAFVSNW